MGVWTCEDCQQRLGLNTRGQVWSSAKSNWCGAGNHRVTTPTRWAPAATTGVQRSSPSVPASKGAPAADAKGQWSLL